jgi:hypothetical protein
MFWQISSTFRPKSLTGNSISLQDKYSWKVLLVNSLPSLKESHSLWDSSVEYRNEITPDISESGNVLRHSIFSSCSTRTSLTRCYFRLSYNLFCRVTRLLVIWLWLELRTWCVVRRLGTRLGGTESRFGCLPDGWQKIAWSKPVHTVVKWNGLVPAHEC